MSKRLEDVLDALPLNEGQRILEIGCGTGVVARAIVHRLERVYVLGIDRSSKAIGQCIAGSRFELATGKLAFEKTAIEDFEWRGEELFDFAFAIRVGALDGRHPKAEEKALKNIAKAVKPEGKLFIDGGHLLQEIDLRRYRA